MRILILAGAALAWLAPAAAQDEPPAPRVRLAEAELRDVAPAIAVPATVASRHDSDVAAETAGRVTFVAEEGALVDAGAPVATLDDADVSLRLAEAEARVRRLEVALAQQSRDVDRRQELTARGAVSQSQLDEVASRRDMTALELAEARIAVQRAELERARARVAAPFTGLVVERYVEVGEHAAPGEPIARLVDIAALEARVQAPVSVVRHVREGMTLQVMDDARTINAPIATIIRAGDGVTRTFELRVDLSGTDAIVGAPVRVRLPSDTPRESLCVPRDALLLRSDGAYVMRVDAQDVVARIAVTPGAGDGEWIEIGDALAPGDRVVVRGGERLRDGQRVDPLQDAAFVDAARAS